MSKEPTIDSIKDRLTVTYYTMRQAQKKAPDEKKRKLLKAFKKVIKYYGGEVYE